MIRRTASTKQLAYSISHRMMSSSAAFISSVMIVFMIVTHFVFSSHATDHLNVIEGNFYTILVASIASMVPYLQGIFTHYWHYYNAELKNGKTIENESTLNALLSEIVFSTLTFSLLLLFASDGQWNRIWLYFHLQSIITVASVLHYLRKTVRMWISSIELLCFSCLVCLLHAVYFLSNQIVSVVSTVLTYTTAALMLLLLSWIIRLSFLAYLALKGKSFALAIDEAGATGLLMSLLLWAVSLSIINTLFRTQILSHQSYALSVAITLDILALLVCILAGHMAALQAGAAERALETKRVFVRHVSHEIRTPLNTTLLGLRLLEQETTRATSERDETLILDLLQDINSSCNIAVELVNDLLLYEKIDGGLLSLDAEEIAIWDLVLDVLRLFRIPAKSAQISLDYPSRAVLRNLISNALKFSPSGSHVRVTAEIVTRNSSHTTTTTTTTSNKDKQKETSGRSAFNAFSERHGLTVFPTIEMIRISVHDSGPGISKTDQQHLFNEIVQFDVNRLQQGQGSGIGLWISHKIMRLHHGNIGVHSIPGQGSIFYVDLPVAGYSKDEFSNKQHEIPDCVQRSYAALDDDLEAGNQDSAHDIDGGGAGHPIYHATGTGSILSNRSSPARYNSTDSEIPSIRAMKLSSSKSTAGLSSSRYTSASPSRHNSLGLSGRSAGSTTTIPFYNNSSGSSNNNNHSNSNTNISALLTTTTPTTAAGSKSSPTAAATAAAAAQQITLLGSSGSPVRLPPIDRESISIHGSGGSEQQPPSFMLLTHSSSGSNHSSHSSPPLTAQPMPSTPQSRNRRSMGNYMPAAIAEEGDEETAATAAAAVLASHMLPPPMDTTNNSAISTANNSTNCSPARNKSAISIGMASNNSSPSHVTPLPEDYNSFFSRSILIVDDSAINRKLVSRLLRDKIAQRDEAADGNIAIDKCRAALASEQQRPYDAIMLDYNMPGGVNGPDAARAMRAMGYTGLIVGVTGSAHDEDLKRFTDAGADHVFIKPLQADAFWNEMTVMMESKAAASTSSGNVMGLFSSMDSALSS